MTKDVFISLRGVQIVQEAAGARPDAADETDVRQAPADNGMEIRNPKENDMNVIEADAVGIYYKKKHSSYILYEEVSEGFPEPVKNKIKFTGHYLELAKSGAVNARMVFEEGVKNISDYHTSYGSILVGTDTKKIHMTEEEDRITVHVDYVLELDGEYVADCQICLDVRSHTGECL